MIIDGGPVGIGVESTIVDVSGDVPAVLSPGAITMEMLKDVYKRQIPLLLLQLHLRQAHYSILHLIQAVQWVNIL